MKRFMVVYSTPDEDVFGDGDVIKGSSGAMFFDNMGNADQFKMDTECGLGGRAQVYRWDNDHYKFDYE